MFQLPLLAQNKAIEIDSVMNFAYHNGAFNGTIMVVAQGEIIYHKAFGFADLKSKELLKTSSAFYLGSLSKQFTTMAIMLLKEQDKISYSDRLVRYFPEFPEYAHEITIKQLMNHTSGLTDYYEAGAFRPGFINDDVLKFLIQQPSLDFAPGEKYSYSNSAYVVLSMIVEQVAGMPFRTFIEKNIFNPLGMNSTTVIDQSSPKIKHQARGFNVIGEADDYNAFTTGGGGMFSTTEDLYLWDEALRSNKLVCQDALEEAFTPTILNDGHVSNYGYGWMIEYSDQAKAVYHTGSLAGFRAYIYKNLTDQNTIIMLTNNGEANAIKAIGKSLQDILSGSGNGGLRLPVSLKLLKLSENNPIDDVIDTYFNLKKKSRNEFDLSEKQLNTFGHMLLMKQHEQEALSIFRLNLQEHTKIINPNE